MSWGRRTTSGGPWDQGHNNTCHPGGVGRRGSLGLQNGTAYVILFLNPDSCVLLPDTSTHYASKSPWPKGFGERCLGELLLGETEPPP